MNREAALVYWQENENEQDTDPTADDVVDLGFRIRCERLPVDHAFTLCSAIHRVLPWLPREPGAGVHLIHGAESGNGWYRPDGSEHLVLSRRTRLNIRIPVARLDDARQLCGETILVEDCTLTVGEAQQKPLTPSRTVFSRHVESDAETGEDEFLEHVAERLRELGIKPRKLVCGKLHAFRSPEGPVHARSVLIADLALDESILLQRRGIGALGAFGFGLILPHKGIEAVYRKADE